MPAERSIGAPIQVLVVDDSAVVRQTITSILNTQPDMLAVAAADPLIAIQKMRAVEPDVLITDLEMPRMSGLEFLAYVMRKAPRPVVVCSEYVGKGSDLAMRALEQGALELITKPQVGLRAFLEESAILLIDTVRAAAAAKGFVERRTSVRQPSPLGGLKPAAPPVQAPRRKATEVIAIGASTGGPDALRDILCALPANVPPVLVVQHMPASFTRSFAARLNEVCAIQVREAMPQDRLAFGCAYIAPGGQHMRLARDSAGLFTDISDGPLVSRHRPSVDVLFRSVAEVAPGSIGVILTGMGDDGAEGLRLMRQRGCLTIAQDEASSVVFGMPRAACQRGAVAEVVPLQELPAFLVESTRNARE